jgi:hypothetical protein
VTLPPPTFGLHRSKTDYDYFSLAAQIPFDPNPAGFSLGNAWWLAESSLLAYCDAATIANKTTVIPGLTAAFVEREGTQAFLARIQDTAWVAFRGTELGTLRELILDTLTDADFRLVHYPHGGRVHRGFLKAFQGIWPLLMEKLKASPPAHLWFTGHSLGAALATLGAIEAVSEKLPVRGLYTYGSPRVGNTGFAALEPRRAFRFVHGEDMVPKVPPRPYAHLGQLRYLDPNGRFVNPPSPSFTERLVGLLPEDVVAGGLPIPEFVRRKMARSLLAPFLEALLQLAGGPAEDLPLPPALAHHAPIYYALHLRNLLAP